MGVEGWIPLGTRHRQVGIYSHDSGRGQWVDNYYGNICGKGVLADPRNRIFTEGRPGPVFSDSSTSVCVGGGVADGGRGTRAHTECGRDQCN